MVKYSRQTILFPQGGTLIITQNLKEIDKYNFNSLDYEETVIGDTIYIKTSINRTFYSCPICESKNIVKNGYNIKTIRHNTDHFWKKIYTIKIPRYKCKNCNHNFYEKDILAPANCNYSFPTILAALIDYKNLNSTINSISKQFHLDVHEFINLFDKYVAEPKLLYLPEVVSFDEKFVNRTICENGYAFVLVDWLSVKILDIVSSRHLDRLDAYFSKISPKLRSYVKYITMDMYDTYLRIAKTYFNNAIIAVDSFHVLQNLIRAFEKVRNKFLRKYDNGSDELEDNSEEYYLLKKGKDLLTVLYGNLSTELKYNKRLHMHISDRTFVNYILKIDSELDKAYWLLQDYLEFNRCLTKDEASSEIDEIIDKFFNSGITSYIEFAKTLSTWKEYILNSFIRIYDPYKKKYRRLSEGPIEGRNSQIQKIHINSNGFSNFNRFKKVVIYKINKFLPFRF